MYSCELASALLSNLIRPPPATQLLACATLFWFAMVLKTIIARAVSSHFMKEAHFAKMKVLCSFSFFLISLMMFFS